MENISQKAKKMGTSSSPPTAEAVAIKEKEEIDKIVKRDHDLWQRHFSEQAIRVAKAHPPVKLPDKSNFDDYDREMVRRVADSI